MTMNRLTTVEAVQFTSLDQDCIDQLNLITKNNLSKILRHTKDGQPAIYLTPKEHIVLRENILLQYQWLVRIGDNLYDVLNYTDFNKLRKEWEL